MIIPLEHPVKIEGENNLKVLKALRSTFCAYEDKCHGLGSYVNIEDWREKYMNDGEIYSIEQSDVDLLQHLISVSCDYTKKKFDKNDIEASAVSGRRWWSLDRAIAYYQEHDKDGERHTALFVIKNCLSDEDCEKFVDWLLANHHDKYHHWKSHKRVAS